MEENNLYGLAYNCPTLQRKSDCPLEEVDHLSFKEKVKRLEGLSKEEKEAIRNIIRSAPAIDSRSEV